MMQKTLKIAPPWVQFVLLCLIFHFICYFTVISELKFIGYFNRKKPSLLEPAIIKSKIFVFGKSPRVKHHLLSTVNAHLIPSDCITPVDFNQILSVQCKKALMENLLNYEMASSQYLQIANDSFTKKFTHISVKIIKNS